MDTSGHYFPPSSARILVIDDDPLVRALVQELLDDQGYQVDIAANGAQGLTVCHREPPNLVITDILMPTLDGLSVIREIKKKHPEVPIIAISGGDRHFMINDLLTVARFDHADATLPKPFDTRVFLDTVARLLSQTADPDQP